MGMFRDVILPETTAEAWPAIRAEIRQRVMASMGTCPDCAIEPEYEVVEEYENLGLRHRKIKYRVLPDEHNFAVIVLPDGLDESGPARPTVIAPPGTCPAGGKYGTMRPDKRPGSPYAIELARRGYVTVSADQFPLGEPSSGGDWELDTKVINQNWERLTDRFFEQYPDWSLDGRRLWDFQRLLDLLDTFDYVKNQAYGTIGISLGGRMAIYLSALDERVLASVPACGISPNLTNIYRELSKGNPHSTKWRISPHLQEYINKHGGETPWDYQHMIALNAPRALLVLEPYNDGGNRHMTANFECYVAGQRVYALLGRPDAFCTLTHGDGHATKPDVREFAYLWFDRWLGRGEVGSRKSEVGT